MAGKLPRIGFRSINMRAPCDEWELAGPRFTRVAADGTADAWLARGTSSHFAVVESSPTGAVEVEVNGPAEAQLQVTVVPLGADLPRLELRVSKLRGPAGELRLRARGAGAARDARAAVGDLVGAADAVGESALDRFSMWAARYAGHRGGVWDFGLARRMASSRRGPSPCRASSPGSGPLVIKVIGTDEKGRRVAAWADVDLDTWQPRRSALIGRYHLDPRQLPELTYANVPNRFADLKEHSRMKFVRVPKLAVALFVAALVIAFPVLADEIKGKIKSIDRARSEIVVADEKTESDVTVSLGGLSKGMGKGKDLGKLKEGTRVTIENAVVAAKITIDGEQTGRRRAQEVDSLGVLAQFQAQPVQAITAVFLSGVSGADPQGGI